SSLLLTLVVSCLLVSAAAPSEADTLSLHDALPIWRWGWSGGGSSRRPTHRRSRCRHPGGADLSCSRCRRRRAGPSPTRDSPRARSEEHTSELQSRFDLVCRLLLEKKKKQNGLYRYQ